MTAPPLSPPSVPLPRRSHYNSCLFLYLVNFSYWQIYFNPGFSSSIQVLPAVDINALEKWGVTPYRQAVALYPPSPGRCPLMILKQPVNWKPVWSPRRSDLLLKKKNHSFKSFLKIRMMVCYKSCSLFSSNCLDPKVCFCKPGCGSVCMD